MLGLNLKHFSSRGDRRISLILLRQELCYSYGIWMPSFIHIICLCICRTSSLLPVLNCVSLCGANGLLKQLWFFHSSFEWDFSSFGHRNCWKQSPAKSTCLYLQPLSCSVNQQSDFFMTLAFVLQRTHSNDIGLDWNISYMVFREYIW